jgi:hypothetical protein
VSTASALHTSYSTTDNYSCGFCGNSHSSDRFPNILKLSVDERHNHIRTVWGTLSGDATPNVASVKGNTTSSVPISLLNNPPHCMYPPPPTTPEVASAATVSHSVGVACSRSDNLCTVLQTSTIQVASENGYVECT